MQLGDDFYKRLLDNLHDGVYFTTTERIITYWNKAAERITGFRADEVVGTSCRDNVLNHVDEDGANLCIGLCPLAVSIRDQALHEREIWLHHKEGHRIPVLVRVAPVHDEKGKLIGAVEIFSDRFSHDGMRTRVEELERMAMMDNLTKAANRGYTETVLQQRLEEYRRYGWPFGVLFFDIDNFKKVNDTYGHPAGDAVLRAFANRVLNRLRQHDLVARYGGEEFAILFPNTDLQGALLALQKVQTVSAKESLDYDGNKLELPTFSAGLANYRQGEGMDGLIRRADDALYRAKHGGRNRIEVADVGELSTVDTST